MQSKFIITLLRVSIAIRFFFMRNKMFIRPTRIIAVPSTKDTTRNIHCNLHEPSNYDSNAGPLPVHINIHGSGFVLSLIGSDSRNIAPWADELGCIVVDADYSKAPEYPFPAGCDDILDIVAYFHSKPNLYDSKRITIGGFSAGGTLAFATALSLPGAFRAIIAFYPLCDLTQPYVEPPKPLGTNPGAPLGKSFQVALRTAYLTPGLSLRNPRISPLHGALENLPPSLIIVSLS